MRQYKTLLSFFNFIGLCPFSVIKSEEDFEARPSKYLAIKTVLKTTVSFAIFAYSFFAGSDSAIPGRIEISYVTSILAVGTITLDYFLLQALLLYTCDGHRKLYYDLMAFDKHTRERNSHGNVHQQVNRRRKLLSIEIIIKSLFLFSLTMILFVTTDINAAIGTFAFLIMLYTILFQFIYNRLFLVIMNEAVDQSLPYIEHPVSRLTPAEIVEITRRFYKCIALYNRVFKYQNLILLKCAFLILLIMFYFTVVLVMAVDFLSGFAFVLVILHFGYDVTSLIRLCEETIRKVKLIKMKYNAEMSDSEPMV